MLFLQKGVIGEVLYIPSHKWHTIRVEKSVSSLDYINIKYIKCKNEWGTANQDMLRCLNLNGSKDVIYAGMKTMCRDDSCQSEIEELGLPSYSFGTVTTINRSDDENHDEKETQVEFEFFTFDENSATRKIKALGRDLLYWGVPENIDEHEAALKMGIDIQKDLPTQMSSDDDIEMEEEEDDKLPPRKRRAPTIFDPASYKSCKVFYEDSDESSDNDDSLEKKLSLSSEKGRKTNTRKSPIDLAASETIVASAARPAAVSPGTAWKSSSSSTPAGESSGSMSSWLHRPDTSAATPTLTVRSVWGKSPPVVSPGGSWGKSSSNNFFTSPEAPSAPKGGSLWGESAAIVSSEGSWGKSLSDNPSTSSEAPSAPKEESSWGQSAAIVSPGRSWGKLSSSAPSTSSETPSTSMGESSFGKASAVVLPGGSWGKSSSDNPSVLSKAPSSPKGGSLRGESAAIVSPGGSWGKSSSNTPSTSAAAASWGNPTSSYASLPHPPLSSETHPTSKRGLGGSSWGKSSAAISPGSISRGKLSQDTPLMSTAAAVACSTSSSTLQYRHPVQKIARRSQSQYATQSNGILAVYRESDDDFFLRWLFGNRVKIFEVGISHCDKLKISTQICGEEAVLVASKLMKSSHDGPQSKFCESKFGGQAFIKAFYVTGDADTIKKELNGVANFSDLAMNLGKLASRLELLVSPAAKLSFSGERKSCMFKVPLSLVEEVNLPDNQTMGCGFIPPALLEDLLGSGNDAKEAMCAQVRVIAPCLGIFKGMLVKRENIDKIQLPPSMKKVDRSTSKKSFKGAFILINNIYPSRSGIMIERQINPHSKRKPTKESEKGLRKLGSMISKMLLGWGVPDDVLSKYTDKSIKFDNLRHAYLVGVCDCTGGGLPPGTVFVTGIGVGGAYERKIFITRSPCTEVGDAQLLPVVSTKPTNMSETDWNHLCRLPFGAVMFSSPSDVESPSLPELINNSDLDGDLFFCLWEPLILSYIEENGKTMRSSGEKREVDIAEEILENSSVEGDNLIETQVPLKVDGKACTGIVVRKADDQTKYVVQCGNHIEIMTSEAIEAGKDIMQEIIDHRGKGRHAEVKMLWKGGDQTWKSISEIKEEYPNDLAQYALEKGLLEKRGWKWAKDYVRDGEIVDVISHRYDRNKLKIQVLYDGDPTTSWEDARDIDVDILAAYAEKNGISLQEKHWMLVGQRIKKEKKNWFLNVQGHLANVKRMHDYSLFVEALHRAHKKIGDIKNDDSISFGKAFKRALDIGKHGGRVALPRALRDEVAKKKPAYAENFLKDE